MAAVTDFPKQVVVALAMTIKHLSAFGVADAFLETKFFSKFTIRTHMLLNGNTLTNLLVAFFKTVIIQLKTVCIRLF